jgi:hypothetical protein
MTALTKDMNRIYELGNINEVPIASGAIIYQGAAIGGNSYGYPRSLQPSDLFLGFAEDHFDNSAGSDGAKNVRVRKRGAILLDIEDITLADINKSVYATDDNSFTLSDQGSVYIGQISRIDSSNLALVEFNVSRIS